MHPLATIAVINSVQKRIAQGDCPTEPKQSHESLEEALLEVYRWHQRSQIRNDPDDEPSAGGDNP